MRITDKVTLTEKVGPDMVTTGMATESGFNQTVRKDQATLIAELISRVTSLEESMEYVLEHLPTTETEVCDECIYVKGSQWCEKCDGKPTKLG